MALNIDNLPIYDPLTRKQDYLNDTWIGSLTLMIQTLQGYLSQFGMFVPNLTSDQRDSIQIISVDDIDRIPSPQLGQLIYNTTTNELQVWQIKTGTAAWRAIDTTP